MCPEFDESVCRDHSVRMRKLEERAAVADVAIERLEKLPDLITALRDAIVQLKVWSVGQTASMDAQTTIIQAQARMMWAVILLILASIISGAFIVIRSGVLAGVP
jgi:hypothetical protein